MSLLNVLSITENWNSKRFLLTVNLLHRLKLNLLFKSIHTSNKEIKTLSILKPLTTKNRSN